MSTTTTTTSDPAQEAPVSLPTVPSSTTPTTKYTASCHCSSFAYSVTTPSLTDANTTVMECNCSICARNGYLFVYVPDECVEFSKGGLGDMSSYTFASRKMAHYFCPHCSSSCLARSTDPGFFPGMTCVNVRMLEGVDVGTLKIKSVDGRSYVATTTAEEVAAEGE